MSRKRTKDKHLPPCVYRSHRAYYFVKANKWMPLGKDLHEALAAYARIVETPIDSVSSLLDRVIEDAKARKLKPRTLDQYETAARKLKPIFKEFTVTQVRPQHIAQVMDHHRDVPAMANRMRTILKLAFDLAVRAGMVLSNPVPSIKPHKTIKRDRYLMDAEYLAIHEASPPALCAIMDTCYLTAQRIGDVLKIKLADLTDDGILIEQEKTGKKLLVQWSPELRKVVADAKALLPDRKVVQFHGGGYLFGQRNGKIRSYTGVRDLWHRACQRAGVEDAHLHDLRAKSLTDADRQGLDAQHLAGHTTEAMTVRYLRDRSPDIVQGPLMGMRKA